ncbi:hypothetical protein EVAR_103517_1 [Eumeta japonica]|uniref:Uncharacterized protein n=1 Tax=Eumeta variegata TaxID=151549 RepID=A0A4C1YVZ9_EUMVA|nr:hypothetical protein EVAR_103517_1 [Eumeta japonica]
MMMMMLLIIQFYSKLISHEERWLGAHLRRSGARGDADLKAAGSWSPAPPGHKQTSRDIDAPSRLGRLHQRCNRFGFVLHTRFAV